MSNLISEKSEKQAVEELRRWLDTEAKFYGRKDEDFLLIFLRGCKFDASKTKKKDDHVLSKPKVDASLVGKQRCQPINLRHR